MCVIMLYQLVIYRLLLFLESCRVMGTVVVSVDWCCCTFVSLFVSQSRNSAAFCVTFRRGLCVI